MAILKGTTLASVGICVALALGGCASATDDPAEPEVQAADVQATPQTEQGTEENVGTTKESIVTGTWGGLGWGGAGWGGWGMPGVGWGGAGWGGWGMPGGGWGGVGWGVPGVGWGMGYPGNINGGFNQFGPF